MTIFAKLLLVLTAGLVVGTFAYAQVPSVPMAVQLDRGISAPSREARKASLNKILSRREFRGSSESFFALVSRKLGEAIGRTLERVFAGLGVGHASKGLSIGVAVVIIVLFLVLLAYVLSKVRLRRSFRADSDETNDLYDGPSSPKKALDEAAQFASSGDYRSALRLVYLAVLLRLDEREMIRFDRTGTNWEYFSSLREHPKLQEMLRPATITFDKKWYGHEKATDRDYSAFVDVYGAVELFEVAV